MEIIWESYGSEKLWDIDRDIPFDGHGKVRRKNHGTKLVNGGFSSMPHLISGGYVYKAIHIWKKLDVALYVYIYK